MKRSMMQYSLFLKSILFLSLFFLSTLATAEPARERAALESGVLLPTPKTIQAFQLADGQGQPFTQENLKGHWTLLFYGFTNCPMLCPTSMAELARFYQKMEQEKWTPMPQVLFVSVDPERDTPQKVETFATTFNPHFIGLRTDNLAMLHQMTHDMSALFMKVNQAGKDRDKKSRYTIDHSGDIMVLNPQGQLVAFLTMPHRAEQIAADYKTIIAAVNATSGQKA